MSAETFIGFVGFALMGGSTLAALLFLVAWRHKRRGFEAGASLLVLGLTLRAMVDRVLPALGVPMSARDVTADGLEILLWGLAAFTLNAALRQFLWFGSLREGDHSRAPQILIGLTGLGLYVCAALGIATRILGLDVTAVAATSGVLAIVLGYSAQPTLSEVFAGMALSLSRPFRSGDSIQIDGVWGVVVDSGWRAVTLRTYEGTLVTLPNTKVATNRLTNLDQPTHQLRHHLPFTVDIDCPPGQVQQVALAVLRGLPDVLTEPKPLVLFKNVTEHGCLFEAIFWHDDPNVYILRRDEIGTALWYGFRRAGIPFAINRRFQTLEPGVVPIVPKLVDGAHPRDVLRLLNEAPLYRCFPEEARATLATTSRPLLFGPHERIIREGEDGSSMFLILAGSVTVLAEQDGQEQTLYTLSIGDTFGHMSLMTGAPRLASVRANEHLALAEITKADLAPLLEAHPTVIDAVAEEISRLETSRAVSAAQARGSADVAMPAGFLDHLADRIRHFLPLT